MSNYNKGIKVFNRYATRKDKQPLKKNMRWGWREKAHLKKHSNKVVRRYKGNLQNGDYKKVFDLWWILF